MSVSVEQIGNEVSPPCLYTSAGIPSNPAALLFAVDAIAFRSLVLLEIHPTHLGWDTVALTLGFSH